MAKFVIPVNEKKLRQKKLFAVVYAILILVCLIIIIFFENKNRFLRIGNIVVFINAVWSFWTIVSSFRDMGKVRFAEINETRIEWFVQEKFDAWIVIEWNDIRWIKNENDGSITIYQDSSFSDNLSMADFSEEAKMEIRYLLQQYAIQKQVRLINFSEPSLAFA